MFLHDMGLTYMFTWGWMLNSEWFSWHLTAQISYLFLRRYSRQLLDHCGPLAAPIYQNQLKIQHVAQKKKREASPSHILKSLALRSEDSSC